MEYLAIIFVCFIFSIIHSIYSMIYDKKELLTNNKALLYRNPNIKVTEIDLNFRSQNPLRLLCSEYQCEIQNIECNKKDNSPFTIYNICKHEDTEIYIRKNFNFICKSDEPCESNILKTLNISVSEINPLNILNSFENYKILRNIESLFIDANRSENTKVFKKSGHYFITHENGITIIPTNSEIISIRLKPNKINLHNLIKNLEIIYN
ncbi:hypothetical protein LEP1GSC017_3993 [Leptospira meyeri serovar Hardjo str. Went 5]|nr:hypothetical protein LEP1GSC017_3993 [Leptospira meyeri serovar Hardjo str. Went 5]